MKKFIYLLSILIILPFTSVSARTPKYYVVIMKTTEGNITLMLYNQTPKHRDNFVKLCKKKTYDGVLFHRVIKEFMIQAGDPDSKSHISGKQYGDGDLGYTIPAEFCPELFHKRGVLASARESDRVNPNKMSSACQFYIVVGKKFNDDELDKVEKRIGGAIKVENFKLSPQHREVYRTMGGTPHLDMQYTVFGEVLSGMDLVDRISMVDTDLNDRPLKDIWIITTEISEMSLKKINKIRNL